MQPHRALPDLLRRIWQTAAGGEIDCLDADGFVTTGAFAISHAITIQCDGVSNGGAQVASTFAITVQAGANDQVVLSGLDIDGAGSTNDVGILSRAATSPSAIRSSATAGTVSN